MSDIRTWLEALGLGEHAEAFEAENITPALLGDLDDGDLKDLGLSMGHRKLVLKAAKEPAPAPTAPPREAERRQITVMFCDLVGSTALSEKLDPEDLRALMQDYQKAAGEVIERFGGHVAQYLGDGLMTYFGWPQAHEDDAERAVRASLDIVEAVGAMELQVRIGIATGPVVVGETGAGDASVPKLAVGETPNLAARLQGLAGADEIVVGPSTRRLLGGTFELAGMGEQALKGIVEPVPAHRVTGIAATEGRFEARHQHLTPLVGREAEMAMVMARWEQAKAGEGQVIVLGGEPGIGKSRITQALRERVADEPHTRLRYQCSPYHTNSALHPVIEQFERAAGFERSDTPGQKLDKLEPLVSDETARALIAALLSLPVERYPALAMSPQKQKEETLRVLAEQVTALAAVEPVLLIFEDAHWIDPTSQELLDLVVPMVAGHNVLAVITHRPEYEPPWTGQGHVSPLMLQRLGKAEAAAMVAQVSERPLSDDILSQIVAKTDGVPLFVEELTKTVLESELLEDKGDWFELTGPLRSLAIPATLKDSLMARLDRLAPVKELAQTGAAIGREFPFRLLAAVTQKDAGDLERDLARLVEAELIFRRGAGEDARYVFKHALIQDTAYDSLLKSNRQELHRRIAGALASEFPDTAESEPEILAHHYTEAGLVEPAIEHWRLAGERAAGRSTNAEAISHLERALALLRTLPADAARDDNELEITLRLGGSQLMAKGHGAPEVEASFNRALELCRGVGEPSRLVRALFGLWRYYIVVPNFRTCHDLSRQLVDLGQGSGESVDLMLAHYSTGFTLLCTGDFAPARTSLDEALAIYDPDQRSSPAYQQGQDPGEACLVYRAITLWLLGYPDDAAASGADAIELAGRIGDPFTEGHAHLFHAMFDLFRRDRESAGIHSLALIDLAEEYGFSAWGNGGRLYRDFLDAKTDPNGGAETLRRNMYLWGDIGLGIFGPFNYSLLAEIHAAAGRFDDALDEVATALTLIVTTDERWWEVELLRLKGAYVLGRDGDTSAAETCFAEALDVARSQGAKSLELRVATSLARLWHDHGKSAEARDLLTPIYGWFTEGFDTADLKDAKALLDELA